MPSDLTRQEREAFTHHFHRSVFPIINDVSKETGSACLFSHRGRDCVVTAHHVLYGLQRGRHGLIPDRPPSDTKPVDFVPLGAGQFVRTRTKTRPIGDDDFAEDVGVFVLSPDAAGSLRRNGWAFMTEADVAGGSFDRCVIFGWPSALIDKKQAGPRLDLEAEAVVLKLRTIQPHELVEPASPAECFLEYPPEEAPDLHGMSGAPVFSFQEEPADGVWHPSKQIKLVGIQHAAHRPNYVRVTQWGLVLNLLEELEKATIQEG